MPQPNGKAIVVGAGPGGLTAAIALRRAGYDVTVCERAARLEAAGSGLTLWPNASRALDALGLLPRLASISRPLTAIAMKDWRGRTLFEDSLTARRDDVRFPSIGVLRSELVELLAAPVQDAIVTGARVVGIEQGGERVVARLADGRELAGEVLVGADGLHSIVRAHLVGEDPVRYAGYTVWRGVAPFGVEAAVGITWVGRAKQAGMFPLSRDRTYWFAAIKAEEGGCGGLRSGGQGLNAAFADAPDPIPALILGTDEAGILRADIYDRPPLKQWSFGRATLLGDAAHPATPALGQGACQAIEDGVMLGACLADSTDVIAGPGRYQARRLRRANAFVVESRRVGQLGLCDGPLVCRLRDSLLGAIPAAVRRKQLTRMFEFAV